MKSIIVTRAKSDEIIKFLRYNIFDDSVVGSVLIRLEERMPDELHLKLQSDDSRGAETDES